jgi:hypothetical protein
LSQPSVSTQKIGPWLRLSAWLTKGVSLKDGQSWLRQQNPSSARFRSTDLPLCMCSNSYIRGTLRTALSHGVRLGLLSRNVAALVGSPRAEH